MKKLAIALLGLALQPGLAHAAGNTATGSASAAIVFPMTLAHWAGHSLNFGSFVAGGGTVVVNAASGAGSVTGNVVFTSSSTTAFDGLLVTAATFQTILIVTGPGTVTSGANSMSFTTTPMPPVGQIATSGTSATASFSVGGTLTVAAGQAAGTYTGSYPVTVTYQ